MTIDKLRGSEIRAPSGQIGANCGSAAAKCIPQVLRTTLKREQSELFDKVFSTLFSSNNEKAKASFNGVFTIDIEVEISAITKETRKFGRTHTLPQ